jgi:two-component system sensor histidine kinase DesK
MLAHAGPVSGERPPAMSISLAPPAVEPLCWSVVRRSWVTVTVAEPRQDIWFVRLATAGAGAFAAALPLLQLWRIGTQPDQGHLRYAVAATVCCLPLQVWLVLSAARETRGRGRRWALVALTALVIGMIPVIGVGWLGALYGLTALVLVSVRPPWSLLLSAALVAVPTSVAFVVGHPEWALYFTIGVPLAAVPLAVVVWLVRVARQLQAARLALAREAIVRERLRIDDDLRPTVGNALEVIAAMGDRAAASAARDPAATEQELRSLVGAARQALADARRMVTRYQEVSLRAELGTAATLLSAAGIPTRLVLPPGQLPDTLDEAARAALRRDVARLLRDGTPPPGVTITVARHHGRVWLELLSAGTDPVTTEVAVR